MLQACLHAYAGLMPTLTIKKEAMLAAAEKGYATATDLADYLVQKGIPFRDAHAVVGKTVQFAIQEKRNLSELSIAELQQFCDKIDEDIYQYLELVGSVAARDHKGGTAPNQVKQSVKQAREYIAALN